MVTAVASEDDVRQARGRDQGDQRTHVEGIHNTLVKLPTDRFPLIVTHATEMVTGDPDERFRFAIDVVVDGVMARATHR